MNPAEIAPVQALKDCKPETVGDLRKMLGFLSYSPTIHPTTPRLTPDFQKLFLLHCDAREGHCAVLYQRQQGKLVIIGWPLTATEKNYHLHSGKFEFLAMKWAICEMFWEYLYYAPSFIVYTDNNPLTYILTTAKLNATTHQWIAELADFSFPIKYRPGKVNEDGLSWMPLDMEKYMHTWTRGNHHYHTGTPAWVPQTWALDVCILM